MMTEIQKIVLGQKEFFNTGHTRDIGFRAAQLKKLHNAVLDNEKQILLALNGDLAKSSYEGYLTEVGIILNEIRFAGRHLAAWSKPRRVRTPFFHFLAASYIYSEPYGVSLIISPWNYPLQLALAPLIGSIAAGNCSVLKPSELAPRTSTVIGEILTRHFAEDYIAVVEGDAQTSKALLEEPFDYIFFTGGADVGRQVMQAAANHLTPLTLELGGKSPCIVDRDVSIDPAARRIASGKFINAGQTCIAPDYLFVHTDSKKPLIAKIIDNIRRFYGEDPRQSPDYPRIVNERHYQRLTELLQKGDIIFGGTADPQQRYIAPTLIENISWEDPVMQQEIFGPILPVIEYKNLAEVLARIKTDPKPLALYIFSNSRQNWQKLIAEISFGGGCINDTLLHAANPHLPFGGVGNSGMGSYHGKASFNAFSHKKSILKRSFLIDIPLRYPPYGNKLKLLKKILK